MPLNQDPRLFFMNQALQQAKKAFQLREAPVGALIVKEGQILSRAHNLRESQQNPLGHAELLAIQKASKKLSSWRLDGCEIYVSLEPCLMCMGAIVQARLSKLVYACRDPKAGFSSFYQLEKNTNWKHKIQIESSVCAEESSLLLKSFFKELRANPSLKAKKLDK